MNKSSKNINEEINRIKSLFTEERMYGNLIIESYTLDDVESKKNELLETLKNWETFNNNRGGFGADQIKKEIDGEIQESITIINGISRSNSCNKKTVKLINEKIEKLKNKKKTAQERWLLKNSDEDRTYYEKVQAYLENMNTICSDIVPDTTPATTTPDTQEVEDGTDNIVKTYYENGELEDVYSEVDGKKEGKLIRYYENGELEWEGNFKNGKIEGEHKSYYDTGALESVGTVVNGNNEGLFKYYNPDGSIYSVSIYKDHKLLYEVPDEDLTKSDSEILKLQNTYKKINPDTNLTYNPEVEVFKDKGGKYHYAIIERNGGIEYWYSTDGTNWKQQRNDKGMDAIEERINSDKVDSLGNVKISSIDSSYTEPEGGDQGFIDVNDNGISDYIERPDVVPGTETENDSTQSELGSIEQLPDGGDEGGETEEVVVDESDVTFKGCKKRLTGYIKLANDGTSMKDAFGDKVEEKTKDIQGCLGKYYNKFEKIGFMKKGKGVYLLKKLWDIDYDRNIDGGIEGQKYEIIVNNRSRGKVKRIGKNEYRVISKPNETIFGRDKNFRDGFEEAVFNSLDLPSEKNDLIVAGIIQKGPIQWAKLLRKDV